MPSMPSMPSMPMSLARLFLPFRSFSFLIVSVCLDDGTVLELHHHTFVAKLHQKPTSSESTESHLSHLSLPWPTDAHVVQGITSTTSTTIYGRCFVCLTSRMVTVGQIHLRETREAKSEERQVQDKPPRDPNKSMKNM